MDLLAPMGIEQLLAIESDEASDQSSERGVGVCLNRPAGTAEELRKIVCAKSETSNDAECAAAAPFECPEKIGMAARIRNANLAIGGDDLGFEQSRCGRA